MKASILLVGNFLSSAGGNRSVGEELAEQLRGAGHSIVTTSHLRFRSLRLLDMLFTTWAHRKEVQAAYVEVYSGMAFLWAEAVCKMLNTLRKPYILTLHGGNLPAFARCWPRRVEQLLKGATAVTAPSRYLLEEMRIYRKDIRLIPNPIELGLYPFRLRSKPAPRLVWLRAFHSIYNPQMAPLVIAELLKAFPDIALTMIGPDKGDGTLQETQNQIEKLGLQKNIEIIAGVPKKMVPEMLDKNDIFLNTTNVDNTPISVIEAMACGLCIVSTNVGGLPYLLEHEHNALLVPPDDPQAMASALGQILIEPDLAEKLSRNTCRKAEQFDWSVILPQWETLFRECGGSK